MKKITFLLLILTTISCKKESLPIAFDNSIIKDTVLNIIIRFRVKSSKLFIERASSELPFILLNSVDHFDGSINFLVLYSNRFPSIVNRT